MIVSVKVIDHSLQRYDTIGDWIYNPDNETLFITISKLGDWRYEMLVALHEQVEAMLCIERGIEEAEVTKFDLMYEREREQLLHCDSDEPGDDPRAPYKAEHFFATSVERLMAKELNVDWVAYETAVFKLDYNPVKVKPLVKARA